MVEKYELVKIAGDYHIQYDGENFCYDLCSPAMVKENWNNVVDRLNELTEEIEALKKLTNNHSETISAEEIRKVLREHKNHLRECKEHDDPTDYWIGALDCVDVISEELRVWIE